MQVRQEREAEVAIDAIVTKQYLAGNTEIVELEMRVRDGVSFEGGRTGCRPALPTILETHSSQTFTRTYLACVSLDCVHQKLANSSLSPIAANWGAP